MRPALATSQPPDRPRSGSVIGGRAGVASTTPAVIASGGSRLPGACERTSRSRSVVVARRQAKFPPFAGRADRLVLEPQCRSDEQVRARSDAQVNVVGDAE